MRIRPFLGSEILIVVANGVVRVPAEGTISTGIGSVIDVVATTISVTAGTSRG